MSSVSPLLRGFSFILLPGSLQTGYMFCEVGRDWSGLSGMISIV